eukprot:403360498
MYPDNKSLVYQSTIDTLIKQADMPFIIQMQTASQVQNQNGGHQSSRQSNEPGDSSHRNIGDSSGSNSQNNINHTQKVQQNTVQTFRKSDVFLEPFEPGICIDDSLTKTHRLLFNKFPSRAYHILIVTKEKEKQGDLINIRDFEALLIPMKTLDGFVFYNSGQKSGASQNHKHIQVIPTKSLPNKKIPINQRVMEEIKRQTSISSRHLNEEDHDSPRSIHENLFILSEYQAFRHTFCRLDPLYYKNMTTEESWKISSQYYLDAYKACLRKLDNQQGDLPYNFIMTPDWMFMVIRRKPQYEGILCNSLGYLGLMYAKNEEQRDKLHELKPIEMLKELAAPMDAKR